MSAELKEVLVAQPTEAPVQAKSNRKRNMKIAGITSVLSLAVVAVIVVVTHQTAGAPTLSLNGPSDSIADADLKGVSNAGSGISVGTIIQIGKEVFQIIKDNKQVLNVEEDNASAIPEGVTPMEMENWRGPKSWGPFNWNLKNKFGSTVAKLDFAFDWRYAGSYKSAGQYIYEATVQPKDVQASWGWTVNCQVQMSSPVNMGTSDFPIASMTAKVTMTAESMLVTKTMVCKASLNGDGSGTILACDGYKLV
eukprot:TRINITY_DN744_c0_g1_i1.p1 TRINITY_DN744_c0_g1~~TRINITY_DN744_c0_g1_i1.p1  ORF type:complete len:251 (+),score=96.41 TRINITY_DN744_c0_g1_i1:360-1112(+)